MSLESRPASRSSRLTTSVSADDRTALKAVAAAERNSRALADALWGLADINGCFCEVKSPPHERRCTAARSALVMALEAK